MVLCVCTAVALFAMTAGAAQAQSTDRNDDTIPDRWEKRHHLSLKHDQVNRDQDRDGVRNKCEYQAKTNPRRKDSDRDGKRDGKEDRDRDGVTNGDESKMRGHCGRKDSDRDGKHDGDELYGEVVSFEAGVLTVKTLSGELVVAPLAEDVLIMCGCAEDEEPSEEPPASDLAAAQNGGEPPPPEYSECTVDDLVPGALVSKAKLFEGVFFKIKLVR